MPAWGPDESCSYSNGGYSEIHVSYDVPWEECTKRNLADGNPDNNLFYV
ncbi:MULTISPECIES: hypothetical protein [unclassified Geodermatophilus]